jgi:hypothetical protein
MGMTMFRRRKTVRNCGQCGQPAASPFTHVCEVKTDFRARKAAAEQARAARSGGGERHDYRTCFYDSQGDHYRAASDCPRFPCRVYTEGHEHGYSDGRIAGYADGHADGYAEGHRDGQAAASQNG